MEFNKKIAIVYDWIDKWGGVERVLLTFHEMFPEAIFYTSYFDKNSASWAKDLKIKTSFLQKFPSFIKKNRILSFPFYPFAFELFDFSNYDLIISVTSSFAKSIITKPGTRHFCYLLTPPRYLWSHQKDYLRNQLVGYLLGGYLALVKKWDYIAAQRPDKIISISEIVKKRCLRYYQRESEVIYPPFDKEYWKEIKSKIINSKFQINSKLKIPNSKFFLVVSRLEPYKKVDLVINTFNQLNTSVVRSSNTSHLLIVGEGSQKEQLKQIAGKNIVFLSGLSDIELAYLYANSQALIMPQEEDFGYVSLEAQFFGCPVIAYKKGGALETIIDGKTGIFFANQNEQSLRGAIERFSKIKYNLRKSVLKFGLKNIERFDKKIFEKNFIETILNIKNQISK